MRRRRRMSARGATAASLAALALACTHCYWLAPYSDLTSDYGRDASVAPGADASATDGGAGDASEAASAGRFCDGLTPRPTFCRDFDEGEALTSGFTLVSANAGGTLSVDSTMGVGQTASLHAAVPTTGGGGPLEFVAQDFDVTTELHIAFDAIADELGNTTEEVTLVTLGSHDPVADQQRSLIYYTTSGRAEIEEERSPPYSNWPVALPGPPTLGKWLHYDLDVVIASQQPTTLTLTVDQKVLLDHQVLGQTWTAGTFRVSFGLSWINQSRAAWSFHYDNLVATAR